MPKGRTNHVCVSNVQAKRFARKSTTGIGEVQEQLWGWGLLPRAKGGTRASKRTSAIPERPPVPLPTLLHERLMQPRLLASRPVLARNIQPTIISAAVDHALVLRLPHTPRATPEALRKGLQHRNQMSSWVREKIDRSSLCIRIIFTENSTVVCPNTYTGPLSLLGPFGVCAALGDGTRRRSAGVREQGLVCPSWSHSCSYSSSRI